MVRQTPPQRPRILILLSLLTVAFSLSLHGSELEAVKPFLQKHCIRCHGGEVQKAELRFDQLNHELKDIESIEVWQGILDQLNRGEMPPPEELQPEEMEAGSVIQTLTEALQKAYAARRSTGGRAVIRRLNKFEL